MTVPFSHGEEKKEESVMDEDLSVLDNLEQQVLALQAKLNEIEVNEQENPNEGFQAHKPTYLLPLALSAPVSKRLQQEIQFQFSIKQKFFSFSGFKLFGAYTQKSFFQFYDEENSRPFRETNYNPELFLQTPEYQIKEWGLWRLDTGYEHESNGQRVPLSRSWDRVYAHFRIKFEKFALKYKTWYRLPEDEKVNLTDSEGDDNPDIEDFYGKGEARLEWYWEEYVLSMMGRYSFDTERGGGEISLVFPFLGKTKGFIQYWNGYGESLIDYNRHLTKIGIGLSFNQ